MRIFTYFIKSLQSVIIIKYIIIYKNYIHFAQTFTSQYIVSLRNIVYIYHQTIKSNNSSVTAPVSTDIFFINYIIRKYTAVNWAFKNVFYKIWTYNISFTECFFFSMFWLKPCALNDPLEYLPPPTQKIVSTIWITYAELSLWWIWHGVWWETKCWFY